MKSNQGKRIEIPEEQLVALHVNRYQAGESLRSIAKELGISDVTMRQKFLDAGLPVARSVADRAWRPESETVIAASAAEQTKSLTAKELLGHKPAVEWSKPPAMESAAEPAAMLAVDHEQLGQVAGEMPFAEAMRLLQTIEKLHWKGFRLSGTVKFALDIATPAAASR